MGNQGSTSGGGKKKKDGGMLCACGRGRDDKDEDANAAGRFGKSTRLTEEEWAAVKTGRLKVEKGGPSLVSEESSSHQRPAAPPREKSSKKAAEKKEENGEVRDAAPLDVEKLRFKVGDRVRCACAKWGNQFEAGAVIKVGYREDHWASSRPTAAYQVKLDKGPLVFAPEDKDEYVRPANEEWAAQLPAGAPWYLQPGALDRELAKVGAYT